MLARGHEERRKREGTRRSSLDNCIAEKRRKAVWAAVVRGGSTSVTDKTLGQSQVVWYTPVISTHKATSQKTIAR